MKGFMSFAKVLGVVLLSVVVASIGLGQFLLRSDAIQQTLAVCGSGNGLNYFGVNEPLGWPGLYPPERLERSLGMMADTGIGWVRVNWAWKDMQPQEGGSFDYTHLDDVARIAAEHGIQVLPILIAIPEWSSTAPDALKAQRGSLSPVDVYRPKDFQDWLHYVQNVVERYDGDGVDDAPGSPRMNYWEVWNEPNIAQFWPPAPDAAEYLALLKATYQTIKAADPTAKVVLGGLANADSHYFQTLYDLGGAPHFDVASVHVYSHPKNGAKPVQNVLAGVRAVMDAHGDASKPLWLTEIGWSDAPNAWGAPTVSQDDMAAFVTAVYSAPLPVDLIFWYNFRNIFPNSPDVEHNFGLVNADFTPKPAYDAYKRLAQQCAKK
jgi:endo-1,4-beta-mannosidase